MKAKVLVATAIASTVLVGCGVSPMLKSVGISLPGQPTAEEREAKRYQALQVEEICDTCSVTGGGNGTVFSCVGENVSGRFGLVGLDTSLEEGEDKGHLQFQLTETTPGPAILDLGGKVDTVECLRIEPGDNGQTTGEVRLTGTLSKTTGLTGTGPFRFVVVVEDVSEPNLDDKFSLNLFDLGSSTPNEPIEVIDCTAPDGNIQIHPTRAAQI